VAIIIIPHNRKNTSSHTDVFLRIFNLSFLNIVYHEFLVFSIVKYELKPLIDGDK